ncbi:uncharacterized protein PRCAT00004404001 [Priceomyces carsonii]|uniref:uncharacterized protein n=1 Tax=Priceomyces carsonii TaxID=28549 RepID=UPI002EDA2230|nr:unnamed protein product [Priceomyces carsonii]
MGIDQHKQENMSYVQDEPLTAELSPTRSVDSFFAEEERIQELRRTKQGSRLERARDFAYMIYHDVILSYSGYSLLLVSQFFNSIMTVTCKLLVTDKELSGSLHPLQILFARLIITFVCCLLYMYSTKSVPDAPWGPKHLRRLLMIRGTVGFLGVFGLYFSLQYLSLSDAVAITFLVPMVTAFLAYVILHERYSVVEGVCSLLSLFGVLLIAKPKFLFGKVSDSETSGDESIESSSTEKRLLASGVGLIGVLGGSSVYIILRKIGKQAHPLIAVSYLSLTCTIISISSIIVLPSLQFVLPKTAYQWFLFVSIGISGFLMQFALTAGVQRVSAGKASMMGYTGMIFSIIWDLIIWSHFPGFLSVLGIILIIVNAVMSARYKHSAPPSDAENADVASSDVNDKFNGSNPISMDDFVIFDDESVSEEDGQDEHQNKNQKTLETTGS